MRAASFDIFIGTLFLFLSSIALDSGAQCISNVDFNTWDQEGDPADGDWVVTGGGSQVEQNINGQPTFYVSPDSFINVIIEGQIEVNTTGDDDFVGFVFGYDKPVGNSNDFDFWLFDWKQADQDPGCGGGDEGFALSRVNGNIPDADFQDHFWCHNNGAEYDLLDSQWGAGEGWNDNQVYDFTLFYTATRAVIMIDNDTIFDETGCFEPGRFGFYNYSQSDVIYSGFQYQLKTDYQILTSNVCVGDTADFLFADTSCADVTATLDSIEWDFGDGSTDTSLNPSHVYSSPGTYNVTLVITDQQGCKDTVVKPIRVFDPPTAGFSGDTVCFGDTIQFTDQSVPGDTAIEDLGYAFGDGNLATVPNPKHSYSDSGHYTVQQVVRDTVGCTDTAVQTLYQPPKLEVLITDSSNISCYDSADGSASAQASGGTPPYSYSWNTTPPQNSSTADSLGPGTYIVEVTDQENCLASDTVTIEEPPELVFSTFNVDSVNCHGACDGEVSAFPSGGTVSGQYNFYWSGGIGGINEAQPDDVCAGTYSLTIEDDSGCTIDTSFTMPEPDPYYVETSSDSANCNQATGQAIVDSVNGNVGPYSFQWDSNTGNQTGDTASGLKPASYDVVITDSKGCDTTATVDVPNIPGHSVSIASQNDASCFGGNDGSATAQVSGGKTPYSYQWNDPAGQTTQTASNLSAGTYKVVVEDSAGCLDSATVNIGEPSPLQVTSPSDTTICINGTATLTANASGGTPGYTYHWDQGLGTGQTQIVAPNSNTNYQVYVEDGNGCISDSIIVSVRLHPPLSVDAFSDDSICPGSSVSLSAIASGGKGSGYTYSWSHGDSGPTTTVAPSNTTEYKVTVEDGCSTPPASDSVEIALHELPDVAFSGTELEGCRPVNARFTNDTDPSDVGSSCIWTFGNGAQAFGCSSVNQSFREPGCYDVKLAVRSPDGCVDSTKKTDLVCVRPYPEADFQYEPKSTSIQDPEVKFTNLSRGETELQWDFAGMDTSSAQHPTFTFPSDSAGRYDVCLNLSNSYGCRDSVCEEVRIEGEFVLYVPNAFTPDGDGVNDRFGPVIQGYDEKTYRFSIYDRWGQKVFESHHPEKRWDGSVNGEGSSKSEVYVWRLVTKDRYTGNEIERTGHVTLVR